MAAVAAVGSDSPHEQQRPGSGLLHSGAEYSIVPAESSPSLIQATSAQAFASAASLVAAGGSAPIGSFWRVHDVP
jgi:hypothetical protein